MPAESFPRPEFTTIDAPLRDGCSISGHCQAPNGFIDAGPRVVIIKEEKGLEWYATASNIEYAITLAALEYRYEKNREQKQNRSRFEKRKGSLIGQVHPSSSLDEWLLAGGKFFARHFSETDLTQIALRKYIYSLEGINEDDVRANTKGIFVERNNVTYRVTPLFSALKQYTGYHLEVMSNPYKHPVAKMMIGEKRGEGVNFDDALIEAFKAPIAPTKDETL